MNLKKSCKILKKKTLNQREIIHPKNCKKLIIITGQQRSGKSTLINIVSSLKGPVNIKIDSFLDSLFRLKRLKLINNKILLNLFQICINNLMIDSSIGRNLNFKKNEESSVWNTSDPNFYLKKIKKNFNKEQIKKVLLKENEITLVLHGFLEFINFLPKNLYKLKIINVYAHPVDQIFSMYKSKTNFNIDNLSREPIYLFNKRKYCRSVDLEKKFIKLNLMQKILLIKRQCDLKEKKASKNQKFINFFYDDLILKSNNNIDLISKFLGKKKTKLTKKKMKLKETINRKKFLLFKKRQERLDFINSKLKNKYYKKILKKMIINFNNKNVQSENI